MDGVGHRHRLPEHATRCPASDAASATAPPSAASYACCSGASSPDCTAPRSCCVWTKSCPGPSPRPCMRIATTRSTRLSRRPSRRVLPPEASSGTTPWSAHRRVRGTRPMGPPPDGPLHATRRLYWAEPPPRLRSAGASSAQARPRRVTRHAARHDVDARDATCPFLKPRLSSSASPAHTSAGGRTSPCPSPGGTVAQATPDAQVITTSASTRASRTRHQVATTSGETGPRSRRTTTTGGADIYRCS